MNREELLMRVKDETNRIIHKLRRSVVYEGTSAVLFRNRRFRCCILYYSDVHLTTLGGIQCLKIQYVS